jgi:hypothetical protein
MRKGGLIFISCGQVTNDEKALGKNDCGLVEDLTQHKPYFAENQNSLEGFTQNILASLDDAVGLIAIMHPRGIITFPDNHQEIRASVWIEQEIAIAAYITQILRRPLKIAPYMHQSIRREGMRDQLLLNAVPFLNDSEVLDHLRSLLPNWKNLPVSLKMTALPKVRVALKRGQASNYLLEFTNDEDEAVLIRNVRLLTGNVETGKVELTEPLKPDDPNSWKVAPHTSSTFGKTIINQTNPAASLVRMNSNEGIFFNTYIDIVVTVEMRGQPSEVRQTIYVRVNATSNEIVQLA